ncbi:MAG TPA: hypothetical protein VGP94_06495 [Tepidisphaeraceae bacterium]|nr:hypothetical protein [Tepidisphaeraceae bacterium]
MSTSSNAKQQVQKVLEQLPDDCSLEDVQYQLYVIQKIRARSQIADKGDFISQAEAEKRR